METFYITPLLMAALFIALYVSIVLILCCVNIIEEEKSLEGRFHSLGQNDFIISDKGICRIIEWGFRHKTIILESNENHVCKRFSVSYENLVLHTCFAVSVLSSKYNEISELYHEGFSISEMEITYSSKQA